MTDADVRRIEAALGIALPEAYRKLVVSFPVPAYVGNTETELWDDAEKLISLNRELREGVAFVKPWPSHMFAMGRTITLNGPFLFVVDASLAKRFWDWYHRTFNECGFIIPNVAMRLDEAAMMLGAEVGFYYIPTRSRSHGRAFAICARWKRSGCRGTTGTNAKTPNPIARSSSGFRGFVVSADVYRMLIVY